MKRRSKCRLVMASLHHKGEEGTDAEAWVCWLQAGRFQLDIRELTGYRKTPTLRRIRAVAKHLGIPVEIKP